MAVVANLRDPEGPTHLDTPYLIMRENRRGRDKGQLITLPKSVEASSRAALLVPKRILWDHVDYDL